MPNNYSIGIVRESSRYLESLYKRRKWEPIFIDEKIFKSRNSLPDFEIPVVFQTLIIYSMHKIDRPLCRILETYRFRVPGIVEHLLFSNVPYICKKKFVKLNKKKCTQSWQQAVYVPDVNLSV